MEYRSVGSTGLRVSELCMGTISFGGPAGVDEAKKMFGAARNAGINHFDCADVYNNGLSEELLGQFVRGCRDEVVIATKAYFPTGVGPNDRGANRYHLVRAVEASLRRLGTDRIDIYYMHRFDDGVAIEETLRVLDDLVSQGKILYLGASNYAAWQVAKALGESARNHWARFACVQPMYNLVKRQVEVEILPMAASEGLGVFTYSPLAGGLLTGKYGVVRRPSAGRLIDEPMYRTRYGDVAYFEAAERFSKLAAKVGHTPSALAVAWVAHHPAVTAPVVGGRNAEQLSDSLVASSVTMTDALWAEISALWPAPPPATDRNEETSSANYGAVLTKK